MTTYLFLRINWREPVTESLSFLTNVWASATGREVREARRLYPRWAYQFQMLIQRREYRQLLRFMVAESDATFFIASPSVFLVTETDEPIGDDFINLPASRQPSWLVEEARVSIFNQPYVVTEVTSSGFSVQGVAVSTSGLESGETALSTEGGNVIITEAGDDLVVTVPRPAIPAGTHVHLMIEARLNGVQEIDFLTDRTGRATVEIVAVAKQPCPYLMDDHDYETFDGLCLMDAAINWRQSLALRLDQERQSFVSETGPESFYWNNPLAARYWSFLHTPRSHGEAQRSISFFAGHRGRLRTFYAPNGNSPMDVLQDVEAGDFDVTMDGIGYPFSLEFNLYPQYLLFRTRKGDFYRRVSGITTGANTIITLQDPIPYDLEAHEFKEVLPVVQSRFSEDNLEISWYAQGVGEMSIKTKMVDFVAEQTFDLLTEDGSLLTTEEDLVLTTEN